MSRRQNLTVSLDQGTIRKAKILAAARGTSVSRLLADYIEQMLREEEEYEAAHRHALALLEQGFHLGGAIHSTREEWHER